MGCGAGALAEEHEIDYVVTPDEFIEVRIGRASPADFAGFPRSFPKARIRVVNTGRFELGAIRGVTLDDFLLEEA